MREDRYTHTDDVKMITPYTWHITDVGCNDKEFKYYMNLTYEDTVDSHPQHMDNDRRQPLLITTPRRHIRSVSSALGINLKC